MTSFRILLACFAGFVLTANNAMAQSTGAAEKAMATIDRADDGLISALRQLDTAWIYARLGFTKAMFIDKPSPAYGQFSPRAHNEFKAGENLIVYAEPVGYGFGKDNGAYLIGFDTDVEVQNRTGQIIAGKSDFAKVALRSGSENKEFQAVLIYAFDGLKAGEYTLIVTFRDNNSEKSARFSLPFSVVE